MPPVPTISPRRLPLLASALAVAALLSAPSALLRAEDAIRLVAFGDGQQELPATGSTSWVAGVFDVDTTANTVSYRIVHSGFPSPENAAHIHGPADPGMSAPPLADLPLGRVKVGVWNYDESQEADILAGRMYVNLHTDDFGSGEVRAQMAEFICDLDGAQPSTPVVTSAEGFGVFAIDTNTNELSYFISFSGLASAEMMTVIHGPANYGESGSALETLANGSPKVGVWSYPEELEKEILAGRMYVDVHTEDFPDGELRGQIVGSVSPMDGDQETPVVATNAVGVCMFAVDADTNTLSYDIRHTDLSSPENAAHIHGPAPAGDTAPPIVGLALGDRKIGADVVSSDELDDFFACLLYVNIHTDDFGAGEIRGQLLPGRRTPRFIRGDFDGDAVFNALIDSVALLGFGFLGGPPPPCAEAADVDGDGVENPLVDAVFGLTHGFVGGPPPPAPYPDCGADPGGSLLGCEIVSCP